MTVSFVWYVICVLRFVLWSMCGGCAYALAMRGEQENEILEIHDGRREDATRLGHTSFAHL